MQTIERDSAYGCEMPTEDAAVQVLVRLLGNEGGAVAWGDACSRAGLRPPVKSLEQLERAVEKLTSSDTMLARIAGRSLKIRLLTYTSLTARRSA